MARYYAHYTTDHPVYIEKLPKGTPKTDGLSLKEAKQEILVWFREQRDRYARLAKLARRLGPSHLNLADIVAEDRRKAQEEEQTTSSES